MTNEHLRVKRSRLQTTMMLIERRGCQNSHSSSCTTAENIDKRNVFDKNGNKTGRTTVMKLIPHFLTYNIRQLFVLR